MGSNFLRGGMIIFFILEQLGVIQNGVSLLPSNVTGLFLEGLLVEFVFLWLFR